MKIELNSDGPYHSFSSVYDEYLAHVDYSGWANYILDLWGIKKQRLPRSILDIACGTGEILSYLAAKKINCSAFDISPNMVKKAKLKLAKSDLEVNFIGLGDMRSFNTNSTFDLCCCNFDSINYLLEVGDLLRFFKNTRRLLVDQGVFIFDAATPYLCSEYYDGTSDTTQVGDITVERSSYFDGQKNILTTEFHFTDESCHETKNELHEQRIYSHDDLVSRLRESGYKNIQYYSDFSMHPGLKTDTLRIHFRAEK